MIDRIDCGHCINNPGPKDLGRCDCYKYPVPYSFLGNDGVIMICRGWIDYIMAYEDWHKRIDIIRSEIIDCLKSRYKIANEEGLSIAHYAHASDGKLWGIHQRVTPPPFDIEVAFMPSFYLKHLHPYLVERYHYCPFDFEYIPIGLRIKLGKQMNIIKYANRQKLFNYTKVHNKKTVAKRHHEILDDLLTKLKQYETA